MQKQKADMDIASGNFEKIYLLCGDEPYLIRDYRDKLKNAIIPESESLNYAYFDNVNENFEKIRDLADTMPFFGDRRLIMIDKASAFKKDWGLADYVPDIPETTTIVIADEDVDKRSRLFKAIQKHGAVMELKKLGLPDIKAFVAGRLKKAGKNITVQNCDYLVECVGDDLNTLANEADKCIAHAGTKDQVDRSDIDAVCSMQIENKIFDMVDAIIRQDGNTVYRLYGDLMALRENQFGIMAVIRRNYNQLLVIRELMDSGCSAAEIASRTKMADWLVRKKMQVVRSYDAERIKKAIERIADTEYSIKTGDMDQEIGSEIMLANLLKI